MNFEYLVFGLNGESQRRIILIVLTTSQVMADAQELNIYHRERVQCDSSLEAFSALYFPMLLQLLFLAQLHCVRSFSASS